MKRRERARPTFEDPDAEFIARVARGDHDAFERLVLKYQHSLLNTIYRYVGNSSEAEDIAQEVFLRLWRNAKDFEGRSKFATWFYRIVVNQCLNHRRKGKGWLASLHEVMAKGRIPESMKVEIGYERRETAEILRDALNELPQTQRMALVLSKYEGRSYREIAHIMGVSVQSITSLIFRAKENLRKKLLPLRVNGDI